MAEVLFVDAKWTKPVVLGKQVIEYFKKIKAKSVALFASVQFLDLKKVLTQIESQGIKVLQTRAKRTHELGQVLGCDAYEDSFDKDIIGKSNAILYIGDGMFHPTALLFAQSTRKDIKPIIIWDPCSKHMRIIDKSEITAKTKKRIANLRLFLMAKTIGIIVTTKLGQSFVDIATVLKNKLAKEGKKSYIFADDSLSLDQLENFPFIDVWVNTACPRIGLDDIVNLPKPMVNARDAMDAAEVLEKLNAS